MPRAETSAEPTRDWDADGSSDDLLVRARAFADILARAAIRLARADKARALAAAREAEGQMTGGIGDNGG